MLAQLPIIEAIVQQAAGQLPSIEEIVQQVVAQLSNIEDIRHSSRSLKIYSQVYSSFTPFPVKNYTLRRFAPQR